MRNLLALFICLTCAFAANKQNALAGSPVEYCIPYSYLSEPFTKTVRPFLDYRLRVDDSDPLSKSVTVVGSDLYINRDSLGSLIKSASATDPTIREIKIEAQRMFFEDELSIQEGKFQFLAKEIVFKRGSSITLLPNSLSSIRIAAEKLTFVDKRRRYFDVRARSVNDDFGDLNKVLQIYAGQLTIAEDDIAEEEGIEKLKTFFTRYPITDFSGKILLLVGTKGKAIWLSDSQNGEWPTFAVDVLRATFQVSPFNHQLTTDLSTQLDSLDEILSGSSDAKAYSDQQLLKLAIESKTDLHGNGPAWLTNKPLSVLLNEIDEYSVDGNGVSVFDFYRSLLDLTARNTPIDEKTAQEEIGRLNGLIKQTLVNFNSSTSRMKEVATSITSKLDLVDDLSADYKVREDRLMAHADELERGQQDRARLVSAISTAAAIATTAYTGNPATGSYVGGAIYAIGAATGGRDAWDSLSSGVQFANSVREPLKEISTSLRELGLARDQYKQFIESFTLTNITIKKQIEVPTNAPEGEPATRVVTRKEALRDIADRAKGLRTGVESLLDIYKEFVPKAASIPAALEEDRTLKELAANIAEALSDIKTLTLETEALSRQSIDQHALIVEATELLAEVQELEIINEQKRRALERIAIDGARSWLSRFRESVELIRRVSLLEYQEDLPINEDQLRVVFAGDGVVKPFDPALVLESEKVASAYGDYLNERKTDVILLATAIEVAARSQLSKFLEQRGRAPFVSLPFEEIINSAGSPTSEREFIEQVNGLLMAQFEARNSPSVLKNLNQTRIELPFSVRSKLDPRFPARLLRVGISRVDISGKASGGDLVFTVDVERVGNVARFVDPISGGSASCVSFDLRPKETRSINYFIPHEFIIGEINPGNPIAKTPSLSYWYIAPEDTEPRDGRTMLVTYPPADARMYLRVRLDPDTSWASAPSISRIDVFAEVFQ